MTAAPRRAAAHEPCPDCNDTGLMQTRTSGDLSLTLPCDCPASDRHIGPPVVAQALVQEALAEIHAAKGTMHDFAVQAAYQHCYQIVAKVIR